jgi:hypothetical protein
MWVDKERESKELKYFNRSLAVLEGCSEDLEVAGCKSNARCTRGFGHDCGLIVLILVSMNTSACVNRVLNRELTSCQGSE